MISQLQVLFNLKEDDNFTPLVNNFRLPQPVHSRKVYYVNLNVETESHFELDCTCNLMGTKDFDCSCNCITGQCNCDSLNGYTGLLCDDCVSGYFLIYNTTCNGLFFS